MNDDLFDLTRQRIARIEALVAEARALDDDEELDAEEEFARRARAGELGIDWQVLQGRIDLGETSRTAIFDGTDDSVAALSVREAANEGVGLIGEEARAIADAEGEPDPVAELELERERLLARGAALRTRLSDLIGPTEGMPR
ncbi:hypothetical protein [Microbacterium sp. Leaf436]|uniref:hypothetical protein n=1 Tax=Microbacterium sp. Leaf436 TaxID=1736377 RepID=UPI0006F1DA6A|nr:hypothetical protein [Microbacterium sp. Leaf436]KQT74174.1 hypothetical protein ASG45_06140 [Microbacterium sp. Leaf436]